MKVIVYYTYDNLEKRTGYKHKEEIEITLDDIIAVLEKGLYVMLKKGKDRFIMYIDTRKFTQR